MRTSPLVGPSPDGPRSPRGGLGEFLEEMDTAATPQDFEYLGRQFRNVVMFQALSEDRLVALASVTRIKGRWYLTQIEACAEFLHPHAMDE